MPQALCEYPRRDLGNSIGHRLKHSMILWLESASTAGAAWRSRHSRVMNNRLLGHTQYEMKGVTG